MYASIDLCKMMFENADGTESEAWLKVFHELSSSTLCVIIILCVTSEVNVYQPFLSGRLTNVLLKPRYTTLIVEALHSVGVAQGLVLGPLLYK